MKTEELEYLVVHCSDTPTGRIVKPNDIFAWHLAPKLLKSGEYMFLGKKYTKQQLIGKGIPQHTGYPIALTAKQFPTGNGWSTVGYSDMIDIEGNLINLTPYSFDDTITEFEVTNGAVGYNRKSRHVVLAGGGDASIRPIEKVLNIKQIEQLVAYCRMVKQMAPNVKIIGHNEISSKTCPNFSVVEFNKKYLA